MQKSSLQSIHIYPIKSCAGIALSNSWVEEHGLSFDRRFVIATHGGELITARTEPKLCLIQASLTTRGLKLIAPNMPILSVAYADLVPTYQHVNVWESCILSQKSTDDCNEWFSRYLNRPCQLLFFGEQSERFVKNKDTQVSFADEYPLLLISQPSLRALNERLSDQNKVLMSQFRPNIVVNTRAEFEEDTWQRIRIGEVEFEVTSPCSRCIFTTINPLTGHKHEGLEPLKTLKTFRKDHRGEIMFGQNLVPLNEGQIKTGDTVDVISSKRPPLFIGKPQVTDNTINVLNMEVSKVSSPTLDFQSWNKKITGNTYETVLEQAENAGLRLPFSCRSGMCGRCKIKLEQGEVKQLAIDGLSAQDKSDGYILSCSSLPRANLLLVKE